MTRDRERTIQNTMRFCQHYDAGGVTMIGGKEPSGHCKAGVVYLDQFGRAPDTPENRINGRHYPNSGIFKRMCCTRGGEQSEDEQRAMCPKWLRSTREQGEERADHFDMAIQQMTLVMPVVREWRTWSTTNRAAKQGVIDCPVCKGRLHLSQSSYNGHVHGQCETAGCVSWME